MKGCPIAHKNCPMMMKVKSKGIRTLIPAPTAVRVIPMMMPGLMPLPSRTQLEGKLMKGYTTTKDMGMSETREAD